MLIIHNNKKRRKVVERKTKASRGKERREKKDDLKEECVVSCVGCQLKDRGDQDHGLIFKMNNKRGRKRETDKRGWR